MDKTNYKKSMEAKNQQSQNARGRGIIQGELQQDSPGRQQHDAAMDVKKQTKK
jgi:hypothetical protein